MPRPSNWNSPTTAIRVPEHAVVLCLALAKELDREGFVQNYRPVMLTVEDHEGCDRYLLPEQPLLKPEQEAALDKAMSQIDEFLTTPDLKWLFIAEFTRRVLKPIPVNQSPARNA